MACTIIEHFMSTTCAHACEILKGEINMKASWGCRYHGITVLIWVGMQQTVCVKRVCLLRLYSSQQREEREEEEKKHLIHSEGLASSTKIRRKPQAVASSLNGHTPSSL